MKIAIAQINPKIGDLNNNTQKIIANIEKAKAENVDLVIFSELSITGYSPFDLLDFESFVHDNLACLDEIRAHTNGIGVIVGFVDFNGKPKGKKIPQLCRIFIQRRSHCKIQQNAASLL